MSDIILKIESSVAHIILSKPKLNILDINALKKLTLLLDEIKENEEIKLISIESDQKVFCAGVDITEHSEENFKEMLESFHNVFFKMLELDVPTVSMVKSACLGGGCELALFSDFVLATNTAYFQQPEINLGCYPPISLVYFPYITSHKKALEIILTGRKFSAEEAKEAGLINNVFKEEEFETESQKFIDSIVKNSASVIKTVLNGYKKLHFKEELKENIKKSENIYFEDLMSLHDTKEGISSFIEKRQPNWKNK